MTSAQNAYWTTGQVTKVTSGTADVNVDRNTTFQRWDGFGGCFNEMGWDALSVISADQVTNAIKLLFDARDGANFVYGRLPIGASDYAMSWYTLDDTARRLHDGELLHRARPGKADPVHQGGACRSSLTSISGRARGSCPRG